MSKFVALQFLMAVRGQAALPKVDPATIIEIGKDVYEAIKDNQPVLNVTTDWAGAVPQGAEDWTMLGGWQGPTSSQPFYVEFKNALGMTLTRFDWIFVWKHHGSYNQTGSYVTEAGIHGTNSYAALTEHLDVSVSSLNPVNYATKDAPIGGIDVTVSVSSHGYFEKTTKTCTMTLKGDGTSQLGPCQSGSFHSAAAIAIEDFPKVDPATVIEIGKDVYQAIKDNQPVMNIETDWAGAVPKGIDDWTALGGWQGPTSSQPFFVEFKNVVGMTLTRFDWNFVWKHHGSYNSTGLYVTEAGIHATNSYAALTEHLDVVVSSLNPVNYGTSENPIGGIDVTVSVSSHGYFEKTTKTCTMTMMGDGKSKLGPCQSGSFRTMATVVV